VFDERSEAVFDETSGKNCGGVTRFGVVYLNELLIIVQVDFQPLHTLSGELDRKNMTMNILARGRLSCQANDFRLRFFTAPQFSRML
jgi:hypothetical protein